MRFTFSLSFHIGKNWYIDIATPWRWSRKPRICYIGEHWMTFCHPCDPQYGRQIDWLFGWLKITKYEYTPVGLEAQRQLDEEIEELYKIEI